LLARCWLRLSSRLWSYLVKEHHRFSDIYTQGFHDNLDFICLPSCGA